MGMGWPGITPGQLQEMMRDPSQRAGRGKHRLVSGPSLDGCGCCPVCREFVYAQFSEAGGLASCPRCGAMIDALDPLGNPSV